MLHNEDTGTTLQLAIEDSDTEADAPLSMFSVHSKVAHILHSPIQDDNTRSSLARKVPLAVGILIQTNQTRILLKKVIYVPGNSHATHLKSDRFWSCLIAKLFLTGIWKVPG